MKVCKLAAPRTSQIVVSQPAEMLDKGWRPLSTTEYCRLEVKMARRRGGKETLEGVEEVAVIDSGGR